MLFPENTKAFNFNLRLKSVGLTRLIEDLFGQFSKIQQPKYRQRLRNTLRMVLKNLNDLESSPFNFIAYTRNHNKRTTRGFSVRNICKVVDKLESMDLVDSRRGYFDRENEENFRRPRIKGTQALSDLFREYGVFQRDVYQELRTNRLIRLRDNKKREIRFRYSGYSKRVKEKVANINALLHKQAITWNNGAYVINDKQLHRVFNNDFKHGGRFYGGSGNWMFFEGGSVARAFIEINGRPTVELDFSAYHPSMAYALNQSPMDRNPYLPRGHSSSEVRKFFKKASLIMLNAKSKRGAIQAIQKEINFGRIKQPRGKILSILMDKYVEAHKPIRNYFYSGIGRKLQFHDSEICEYILLHFQKKEVPVLPVHDSFVIGVDHEQELRDIMKEAYRIRFGVDIDVDKKRKIHDI